MSSGNRALSLIFAAFVVSTAAHGQITQWIGPSNGTAATWNSTANWNPADIPDTTGEIANFRTDWTANQIVTLDGDKALNGLIFQDVSGSQTLTINAGTPGTSLLSLGGANPFITVSNSTLIIGPDLDYTSFTKYGGGILQLNNLTSFNLPLVLSNIQAGILYLNDSGNLNVNDAGFTKAGGGQLNLAQNLVLTGSGTVTVAAGAMETRNASNFTGNIVVDAGASYIVRGVLGSQLGDTNGTTTINGTSRLSFQETAQTYGEAINLNGFRSDSSLYFNWSAAKLTGPITLTTNTHIGMQTYNNTPASPTISGVIDDGARTNGVTFTFYSGGAATGVDQQFTNYLTQSRLILAGSNTYGGPTYITVRDGSVNAAGLTFTVELTNGNNRLPATTVLTLGGAAPGISGGNALANGRLLLNGVDQELAGLATLGTGTNNQIAAGSATQSTLTLNVASGSNYTFAGRLGGPNANGDNLALIKTGLGQQTLRGSNTYTGQTVIQQGILEIANGAGLGSTAAGTVISNFAQLRLSGDISVDEELTVTGSGPGGSNLGVVRNVSGSNVLTGGITFTPDVSGRIQAAGGTLVIAGGLTTLNQSVMLAPSAGASITVQDTPLNLGTGTLLAHDPGTLNLNASGNVMGTLNPAWSITTRIGAANALPTNVVLTMGQSGPFATSGRATFDLNGFDVTVGRLQTSYSNGIHDPANLIITNAGASPSTLAIIQSANTVYDGRLLGDLSLTKDGAGSLNLAGINLYSGQTIVSNGILAVNGSHLGGGAYTVAGGQLGGTGLIDAAVHVLAGGVVAPGNSIGTMTVDDNVDLDGILSIELANSAGPGGLSDLLDVNGFFDITNGVVQFVHSAALTNDYYVFAQYDSLSGNNFLDVQNLPTGYTIDYTFGGGNQIALVIPEPSTLALLIVGLGLAATMARRRR